MKRSSSFLDEPRAHPVRRALFQVHLWLGVVVGVHLTVICLSGSLLIFRSDMQRASFPELLASTHTGAPADITDVLAALEATYPGQHVSGIDSPTAYRQTYLAYVAEADRFHTILSDPADGHVLGELPSESWIGSLQSLHFNLLMGRTGRLLNQLAVLCLLGLLVSGAGIWWQGRRHWRRGLRVRNGPWSSALRNLHGATGAWLWTLLLMVAITASSLMFPSQFRSLVVSLTPAAEAEPTPFIKSSGGTMSAAEVIRGARALYPSEFISRVVLPTAGAPTYQINFARHRPTALSPSAQRIRYFDRVTGAEIDVRRSPPMADKIIAWTDALHVGNFAGNGTRFIWSLLGLAPPLLFVTGAVLWWRRVVRPALTRSH